MPIVRVVDADLTERMTEWVVLQVLLHHRRQRALRPLPARAALEGAGAAGGASGRVGIMGMGVLGRAAAAALRQLGFRVAGWSRSGTPVDGVETFAGPARLDAFLARTDILVSLLPLTAETRGILAMPLFRKLVERRPGAAGRW